TRVPAWESLRARRQATLQPPSRQAMTYRSMLNSLAALVWLSGQAFAQGDLGAKIDQIFARFTATTPGCAVGLAKDGKPLYTHGYGMANLEYGVPITESTVLESGSVAKQFTASALVLLAQDGKLSLDDDIRKYLP